MHLHQLKSMASLRWEGNRGNGTRDLAAYDRAFRVDFPGKCTLLGSADPHFRGDPERPNPEELFVAALSACHMLTWLGLCARAGVQVEAYHDEAEGTVDLAPGGGGRLTSVVLRPVARLAAGADAATALALHETASRQCFLAASCNFPVRHQPRLEGPEHTS